MRFGLEPLSRFALRLSGTVDGDARKRGAEWLRFKWGLSG